MIRNDEIQCPWRLLAVFEIDRQKCYALRLDCLSTLSDQQDPKSCYQFPVMAERRPKCFHWCCAHEKTVCKLF